MQYYFDDPEVGLSPETSHPNFASRFTDDMYYDCADDFSPFGNDEGSDALHELQEWYKETQGTDDIMAWLWDYIDSFGFAYPSKDASAILAPGDIAKLQDEDPFFLRTMDNTIIATAFGQYKITGALDPRVKSAALLAIDRLVKITTENNTPYLDEFNRVCEKMRTDLLSI